MKRMYDTNSYVLVARKSDYDANNIKDGYLLIPKEEWLCKDDGIKTFRLFHTRVDKDRIYLFLTDDKKPAVLSQLPLSKRVNYIEI